MNSAHSCPSLSVVSKAKRDFGYSAAVSVKQGIEMVVQVALAICARRFGERLGVGVAIHVCLCCCMQTFVDDVSQAVKEGRHPVHSPQATVRLC